jgi:hypothetical protein
MRWARTMCSTTRPAMLLNKSETPRRGYGTSWTPSTTRPTRPLHPRPLGEAEGTLCTLRPGRANTEGVSSRAKVTDVLVWTVFLKDHHQYKEFNWPAHKEDHTLAFELFHKLSQWLEDETTKPNNPQGSEWTGYSTWTLRVPKEALLAFDGQLV